VGSAVLAAGWEGTDLRGGTVASDGGERVGLEVANGRYRIVGRIGHGSMGQVYLAHDCHLDHDVVLKFPVPKDEAAAGPEFLDRFAREIQALVRLSHPHVVRVIDAGDHEGRPFVVMQFLAGGSLKDRMASGPGGEIRPLPPQSLACWLLEIGKALDFLHEQNHIHRDVKPANILFDRHDNPFLGDFGIIKALASEEGNRRASSLTAPGFLLGTPNYVAPEIVMGRPFDGRVDQYALAMTVHEVLCGRNCMEGPTPSATVVNQTMVVPPALIELIPGVPPRLSDAVLKGLAKEPDERFESCAALAREILEAVPTDAAAAGPWRAEVVSRGQAGRVPCPACQEPMPVGREHVGGRVRCPRCRATSLVSLLSSSTVQLKLLEPADPLSAAPVAPIVVEAPDPEPEPDSSAATVLAALPAGAAAPPVARQERRAPNHWGSPAARRLAVGVVALAALAYGGWLWSQRHRGAPGAGDAVATVPAPSIAVAAAPVKPEPQGVQINVAYGTEKQRWFEAAAAEFQKSAAGRGITVSLHGMGSMEGARAVLEGPGPIPMQVWSPASSAYRELFERQWRAKHGRAPILQAENLAMTPMIFVMWESRRDPFIKKYAKVRFQTLAAAMEEPGGWGTIGAHPEWGRFKFGHTHPNESNSGLISLVLMAYEYFQKEHNLSHSEIAQAGFQRWLRGFELAVARPGGALSHSTGTLMREMVLRGPSQYDCLVIYENLAIDYLDAAKDRWGPLVVDYPEPNMWNEHPYYILDVPWSDPGQRAAARAFLKFLMSEPVQRRALDHGFRPGNPDVSLRFADSPLIRHAGRGLRIDLPRMCEPPSDDVVQNLLAAARSTGE
jgi:serine/threonine-protein kinase